jgi:hypothetical protein
VVDPVKPTLKVPLQLLRATAVADELSIYETTVEGCYLLQVMILLRSPLRLRRFKGRGFS